MEMGLVARRPSLQEPRKRGKIRRVSFNWSTRRQKREMQGEKVKREGGKRFWHMKCERNYWARCPGLVTLGSTNPRGGTEGRTWAGARTLQTTSSYITCNILFRIFVSVVCHRLALKRRAFYSWFKKSYLKKWVLNLKFFCRIDIII